MEKSIDHTAISPKKSSWLKLVHISDIKVTQTAFLSGGVNKSNEIFTTRGKIVVENVFEQGYLTFNKFLKYLFDKHSKLKLHVKKKLTKSIVCLSKLFWFSLFKAFIFS